MERGWTAERHGVAVGRGARRVLLAALLATAVALVSVARAQALVTRGHVFGGLVFGSTGKGPGQLKEPVAVAVNESSGDVYVADSANNRVELFSSTGVFISQFVGSGAPKLLSKPTAVAVDDSHAANPAEDPSQGDVYVLDSGHNVIDKFTAAGVFVSQLKGSSLGPFGPLEGIAVDDKGVLWVKDTRESENGEFTELASFDDSEAGIQLTTIFNLFNPSVGGPEAFFTEPFLLAVDQQERFYASEGGEAIQFITLPPGSHKEVFRRVAQFGEGRSTTGVAVDARTGEVYEDFGGSVAAFTPGGATEIEQFTAAGMLHGAGIAVNSATDTVFVADEEAARVEVFEPEPPAQPVIDAEWSSSVASTSASLDAAINARGSDTTYRVEYGETTAYGAVVPAPAGDIGSGFGDQTVGVPVAGLSPATTYHYRFVASSALDSSGPVRGEDHTFTTRPASAFALLDGREWELVSPPDKHGSEIVPISEQGSLIQASQDGSAITYVASSPVTVDAQGHGEKLTQILSTRTSKGWSTQDIAARDLVSNGANEGTGNEYRIFSPDLSLALVEQNGDDGTSLGPEATERTPYLRDDGSGDYLPLLSAADVPPGTRYGTSLEALNHGVRRFKGGSPDLRHVVLGSQVALTATAVPPKTESLFEWSTGGDLQLVSVLPNGSPAVGAGLGGEVEGSNDTDVRHAISKDGSLVFWGAAGHLYVSYVSAVAGVDAKSVKVDTANKEVAEPKTAEAVFQTASSDGSRVFFTDGQKLTSDATAEGQAAPDLYECKVLVVEGRPECAGGLIDLTADANAGEHAAVRGTVIGASEDGSYVYYVANGRLAPGALGGDCVEAGATPAPGAVCNLYLWHEPSPGVEVTTLVAVLSNEDRPGWGSKLLVGVASRVAPGGGFLAFMSDRSLTGYDNVDVSSGRPDEEVYLYDAATAGLVCASCNPTGARPQGLFDTGGQRPLVDGTGVWAGHWIAGSIPGWTPSDLRRALYQSQFLSDEGRLFFDSSDGLVPQDTNRLEDVYEFEPEGVGGELGCRGPSAAAGQSATFNPHTGGCVALVSSGISDQESAFLDASTSGADVFFLTSSQLVAQDVDGNFDVYDAHVCSAQAPCAAAPAAQPACGSAEECRGAPSAAPEVFGPPASVSFSGVGNLSPTVTPSTRRSATRAQLLARALRACRAKRGRRRAVCIAQARRRYGVGARGRARRTHGSHRRQGGKR
jgi:hypothetical protein